MNLRSLFPFLSITFGLTWGLAAILILFPDQMVAMFGELSMTNPLFILAVYAPAFAAFALVVYHHGARGLGKFLSRLLLWRCHPAWYAFIVAGIPILMLSGAALKGKLGKEAFPFDPWYQMFPALAVALVIGPIEEFGWRGLALPLLQRRFAPLWAALILGAIWGVWHIPAFLLGGTPQSSWSFVPFFLATISISVVMTALLNASGGSLLLVALIHFQLNSPLYPPSDPYDSFMITLAAVIVIVLNRKTMLSRNGSVTDVVPLSAVAAIDRAPLSELGRDR